MKRFIEGLDRGQGTLFPEHLEDWIGEDNPVRVIDVFVDPVLQVLRKQRALPAIHTLDKALHYPLLIVEEVYPQKVRFHTGWVMNTRSVQGPRMSVRGHSSDIRFCAPLILT